MGRHNLVEYETSYKQKKEYIKNKFTMDTSTFLAKDLQNDLRGTIWLARAGLWIWKKLPRGGIPRRTDLNNDKQLWESTQEHIINQHELEYVKRYGNEIKTDIERFFLNEEVIFKRQLFHYVRLHYLGPEIAQVEKEYYHKIINNWKSYETYIDTRFWQHYGYQGLATTTRYDLIRHEDGELRNLRNPIYQELYDMYKNQHLQQINNWKISTDAKYFRTEDPFLLSYKNYKTEHGENLSSLVPQALTADIGE